MKARTSAAMVYRPAARARMDSHAFAAGPAAAYIRTLGLRSGVGVPIIVDGRLWGRPSSVDTTRTVNHPTPRRAWVTSQTSSQLRSRTPRHAHSSPLPGAQAVEGTDAGRAQFNPSETSRCARRVDRVQPASGAVGAANVSGPGSGEL